MACVRCIASHRIVCIENRPNRLITQIPILFQCFFCHNPEIACRFFSFLRISTIFNRILTLFLIKLDILCPGGFFNLGFVSVNGLENSGNVIEGQLRIKSSMWFSFNSFSTSCICVWNLISITKWSFGKKRKWNFPMAMKPKFFFPVSQTNDI